MNREERSYGVNKKFKSDDYHRSFDEKTEDEAKNEDVCSNDVNEGCDYDHDDVREAGPYFLGPLVRKIVPSPASQCLARKKGTDDYYLVKILLLNENNAKDKFYYQRRTVFYTEYRILSMLKGEPGVIQLHDFFKDYVYDDRQGEKHKVKRMCMVLECLIPHRHHNVEMMPLIHYIKEKKKLSELEALHILHSLLKVVEALHNRNIVHRDLKLCNIILNRRTLEIKLINFYYAKLISKKDEVSCSINQSSPVGDHVTAKSLALKPCDMWSIGVVFYAMLHGCLPGTFTSAPTLIKTPTMSDIYSQIKLMDYTISNNICISDGTKKLIMSLMKPEPCDRLTATEAFDMVSALLALQLSSQNSNPYGEFNKYSDQIVPECKDFEDKKEEKEPSDSTDCWLIVDTKTPSVSAKAYKISISEVDPISAKSVAMKVSKFQDQSLSTEEDAFSKNSTIKQTFPLAKDSTASKNNKIKFAMLRLGATSVNNINALSFSYSNRNP